MPNVRITPPRPPSPRLPLLGAVLLAIPTFLPRAHAIIIGVDGETNTTGAGIPGFDHVGNIYGSSGVYYGNGWVLTASHVGLGNFTLNGVTYAPIPNSGIRIVNTAAPYANTYSDLYAFRIANAPDLPTLTLAPSTPTGGTAVNLIGAGTFANARNYWPVSQTGTAWSWGASSTSSAGTTFGGIPYDPDARTTPRVHWGSNVLNSTNNGSTLATRSSFGYTASVWVASSGNNESLFFDFYNETSNPNPFPGSGGVAHEAKVAPGDSGGGLFDSSGNLLGILNAMGDSWAWPLTPATLGNVPASTAFFGDMSYALNVSRTGNGGYGDQLALAMNEWQLPGSGSWTTPANWTTGASWTSGATPNATGQVAAFLDKITTPATISLATGQTVGYLTFANSNSLYLAGPGSLTLNNYSLGASLSSDTLNTPITHTIAVPLILSDYLTLTVSSGTLALTGALTTNGKTIDRYGPGTLTLSNPLNVSAGTTLIAREGLTVFNSDPGPNLALNFLSSLQLWQYFTSATVSFATSATIGPVAITASTNLSGVPGNSPTLALSGPVTLTIPSLTMAGGIVQTGSGTLLLSGNVSANSIGTAPASGIPALIAGHLDLGNAPRTFTIAANSSANSASADLVLSALLTGSPGAALIKTGPGILALTASANTFSGPITVNAGTLRLGQPLGTGLLTVTATGTLQLQPGLAASSPYLLASASALAFSGTASRFDITNNPVRILNGTASLSAYSTHTLTSTAAPAPANGGPSQLGVALLTGTELHALAGSASAFGGAAFLDTDLLLQATYLGDANLDGKITLDDYLVLDAGFLFGGTDWAHGDFTGDTHVSAADYAAIDNNYLHQNGLAAAYDLLALHASWFGADYLSSFSLTPDLAPIPEPASLAVLSVATAFLLLRRRPPLPPSP